MLNSLLSFFAVLAMGYFLHSRLKLRPSVTPLVSISALINLIIVFGLVNKLWLGAVTAYAVAFIGLGYSVFCDRKELFTAVKRFFSPAIIMFTVSGLLFMALLFTRKPMFFEWDEFSFWGTARKLVKTRGALYTFYKSSMIGNSTPPALRVLSYFFQFFTAEFLEHACFFAYDVLILSAICAFSGVGDDSQWDTQFFLFLFGFTLPYLFRVYTKLVYLDTAYISSYSEIPLSMVFMGRFCVYYSQGKKKNLDILSVLPVLMLLTLTKDMGLALSCVVAFVIFFDLLCQKGDFSLLGVKGILGKILSAFLMLITTGGAYFAWSFHMSRVMQRDRFAAGGNTNLSTVGILVHGIKALLGIGEKGEKFSTIQGYMLEALFKLKVSIFGNGVCVIAIITLIFLMAFLLREKSEKTAVVSAYITSTLGFVGYYVFHLFLYVYIFKANGYTLVSYNRYIGIYYCGWLAIAVMVLADSVRGKNFIIAKVMVMSLSLIAFGLFSSYADLNTIFVQNDYRAYNTRNSVRRCAEFVKDAISPDDVIYAYCKNDERWFMYTLEFSDNIMAEVVGIDTDKISEDEIIGAWQKHLSAEIERLGITAIMVEGENEFLQNTYGQLFSDGLSDLGEGKVFYYRVTGGEELGFELVKGGAVQ